MSAATRAGAKKIQLAELLGCAKIMLAQRPAGTRAGARAIYEPYVIGIGSNAIRAKIRPEGIATLSDGNLPSSSQNDNGSGEAGSSR
jgi:hypothetical protein